LQDIEKQIRDIIEGKNEAHKDASHVTVFKELLDSDLPPEEKTLIRLRDEGFAMVNAGIETTRWTLSIATFHLLDKPRMLSTLKAEIRKAWPDIDTTPSLQELERLPYLTAVIQEGRCPMSA
jgi:cytochrome P450